MMYAKLQEKLKFTTTKVLQYTWKDLPMSTQQRVKALMEHKLSLDYDPTMVDPEWRG
jgi:hypothetical protein